LWCIVIVFYIKEVIRRGHASNTGADDDNIYFATGAVRLNDIHQSGWGSLRQYEAMGLGTGRVLFQFGISLPPPIL
jgi:hypothetical protein